MLANTVLDVAMGLTLLYLMLSLLCTTVNEVIANALGLRASTLASGLQRIIDDPVLKSAFFDHGLIGGAKSSSGQDPSYLSGSNFAMALTSSLDPTKPFPVFADITNAIQLLPDSNIRDILLAQVNASQGDVEKFRNGLAVWFDHSMDRVSGIYKRQIKWISLVVGILTAVILNADTVNVAQALWSDESLRAEIAAVATNFASQTASDKTPATNTATTTQSLTTLQANLHPFPLGWNYMPSSAAGPEHGWIWQWISRIVGLSITAIAISLGAPFWFDLLTKFVNIRSTGEKPDRTEVIQ